MPTTCLTNGPNRSISNCRQMTLNGQFSYYISNHMDQIELFAGIKTFKMYIINLPMVP